MTDKARWKHRAFRMSGRNLRLGEGGHPRLEVREPCDELRMALAPCSTHAEVEIAEGAGQRDVPDMEVGGRDREMGLGMVEPALDLALLQVDPLRLVLLRHPEAALVDLQKG